MSKTIITGKLFPSVLGMIRTLLEYCTYYGVIHLEYPTSTRVLVLYLQYFVLLGFTVYKSTKRYSKTGQYPLINIYSTILLFTIVYLSPLQKNEKWNIPRTLGNIDKSFLNEVFSLVVVATISYGVLECR
jgi:hypothetical protein